MDLSLILGPVILAVVANAALYGICVVQWYNYSMGGYRDPWPTRALVFWVMLINTFQTASSTYMLWVFTVPNFGNPMIFIHVPWPYPTTPIFSKISVPIQHFLAYRIKNLSHSWIPYFCISALSIAQGACAVTGGVLANVVSDPADFASLTPVADAWVSIAVFTDILITGLLFYYLHKSKTGFQRMDGIIERLIRTAVETAAVGAAFCIIDIIMFTTKRNTNMHFFFAMLQSGIYINTLMVTLNSRASLREKMSTNEPQFDGPGISTAMRMKHTEVSINVHQDIQMDSISPGGSENDVDQKIFYPV